MLKDSLKTIIISLAIISLVGVVNAWVEPDANPPSNNTSAPIDVSSAYQYKTGSLSIGEKGASGDGLDIYGLLNGTNSASWLNLAASDSNTWWHLGHRGSKSEGKGNFSIWYCNNDNCSNFLFITPSGTVTLPDNFVAGGKNLVIGDDSYLTDVDIANTLGIYGISDSTQGKIRLGSGGPLLSGANGNIGIGNITPTNSLDIETANVYTSGISLNSKPAMTNASGDSWLRLNQSNLFTSGVYTPGNVTADGGFSTTWTTVPPSGGGYFRGDVKIDGNLTVGGTVKGGSTSGYSTGGIYATYSQGTLNSSGYFSDANCLNSMSGWMITKYSLFDDSANYVTISAGNNYYAYDSSGICTVYGKYYTINCKTGLKSISLGDTNSKACVGQ